MKISINKLAELTGKASRTIKARLSDLKPEKQGAALTYDSAEALAAIYAGYGAMKDAGAMTLTEARTRESLAKAEKTEIEIETMQKQRIPVDVINDAIEPVLALHKQIIMGSKLSDAEKREICESLRDIPRNMKW